MNVIMVKNVLINLDTVETVRREEGAEGVTVHVFLTSGKSLEYSSEDAERIWNALKGLR